MNDKIIQDVFEKIQEFLPAWWKGLSLYVGYTGDSYTMKFFVKNEEGKDVDCFNLGIDDMQLTYLFMDIDEILFAERNSLSEDKRWNILTMIVDSLGNVKLDFDYADIRECAISYQRAWEEKYLKL